MLIRQEYALKKLPNVYSTSCAGEFTIRTVGPEAKCYLINVATYCSVNMQRIAVFGASGAIGGAIVNRLLSENEGCQVHAFARVLKQGEREGLIAKTLDMLNEDSLATAAAEVQQHGPLDMVVVATGLLHAHGLMPEKSLRDLSADKFQHLFQVNTILPALVAKHFLPVMHTRQRAVFAALSARVGSVSDNRLGGWYAYRASKAALNMVIRNAAIETTRRNPQSVVVGIHPGTVDSELSAPFQSAVRQDKLFTPEYSATSILNVLEGLTAQDSGKCFAWDGQEVLP